MIIYVLTVTQPDGTPEALAAWSTAPTAEEVGNHVEGEDLEQLAQGDVGVEVGWLTYQVNRVHLEQ